MATVKASANWAARNSVLYTWTPLTTTNDVGEGVALADYADASIQVISASWGSGGTVVFEGSNDGTNWFTLTDAQTVAISKTSDALEQLTEVCWQVRPHVTAGDGTTAITATLYARRGN